MQNQLIDTSVKIQNMRKTFANMETNIEEKISGLQKSLESMMTYVQLKSQTIANQIKQMCTYIQDNPPTTSPPLTILVEHRMVAGKTL